MESYCGKKNGHRTFSPSADPNWDRAFGRRAARWRSLRLIATMAVSPASAGPVVESRVSERVLVFGDDAKAFLAVARSLGRKGIEVHAAPADFASPALKSRYIAAAHRLPSYWLGAERWAEAVAALADRERIGLIVPTSDASLMMLMRHADRLGRERLALPGGKAARNLHRQGGDAAARLRAWRAGLPRAGWSRPTTKPARWRAPSACRWC